MQTFKITKTLCAVLVISFLFSCQKEKGKKDECGITVQNITGKYLISKITYKLTPTSEEADYTKYIDACEIDNMAEFKPDGKYILEDIGLKCDPDFGYEAEWKLEGNTIILDNEEYGKIKSFDCKTLVIYEENLIVQGDRYTITLIKK